MFKVVSLKHEGRDSIDSCHNFYINWKKREISTVRDADDLPGLEVGFMRDPRRANVMLTRHKS